jgi:hypothetical protein
MYNQKTQHPEEPSLIGLSRVVTSGRVQVPCWVIGIQLSVSLLVMHSREEQVKNRNYQSTIVVNGKTAELASADNQPFE